MGSHPSEFLGRLRFLPEHLKTICVNPVPCMQQSQFAFLIFKTFFYKKDLTEEEAIIII